MTRASLILLCVGIAGLTGWAMILPSPALMLCALICSALGLGGVVAFLLELATRDYRLAGYKAIALAICLAELFWMLPRYFID